MSVAIPATSLHPEAPKERGNFLLRVILAFAISSMRYEPQGPAHNGAAS
jgi:hypothetical protein